MQKYCTQKNASSLQMARKYTDSLTHLSGNPAGIGTFP